MITCCNGCVPPKRTPTCHATCPEYAKQKAKYDAELEQINKARGIQHNLNNQTGEGVAKAYKRKKTP